MAEVTVHPIQVDIHLPKGEFCYIWVGTNLYEEHKVTKNVSWHGPTLRLKIIPGIYYRAGNFRVGTKTENEFRQIDSGYLYVTNERFIFIGATENQSIYYKKVLDVKIHKDGVEVVRDTGTNRYFAGLKNAQLIGDIVKHFLSEGNNP